MNGKYTFQSYTFRSWTYASGHWTGTGTHVFYTPVAHYHTIVGATKELHVLKGPTKKLHVLMGNK